MLPRVETWVTTREEGLQQRTPTCFFCFEVKEALDRAEDAQRKLEEAVKKELQKTCFGRDVTGESRIFDHSCTRANIISSSSCDRNASVDRS